MAVIPPLLRERANFIFSPFGGILEAEKLMSSNKIIDISLFNGYTIVITPVFTNIRALDGAFDLGYNDDFDITQGLDFTPEEGYDLTEVGYTRNTPYFLLDENFNFIYTDTVKKTKYLGEEGYFFGFTEKEKRFIYDAPNASLFYLSFTTHLGPHLVQLLINKNKYKPEYELILEEWRKKEREYSAEDYRYNEIFLKFPDPKYEYTVHVLLAPLKSGYTERDIALEAKVYNLKYQGDNTLYLNIKDPVWMSIRHYYYEDFHPATENLNEREFVDVYNDLTAAGFYSPDMTLLSPEDIYNDKITFIQSFNSGYTEEITVYTSSGTFSDNSTQTRVYTYERIKYKALGLLDIEGINKQKLIVRPDNAIFLQTDIKENISPLGYSGILGQKVITTFKPADYFKIFASVSPITPPDDHS
jgi:hypothetical protein